MPLTKFYKGDIITLFMATNTIQYRGAAMAMAAETARAEPFNLIRVIPA